MKNRQFIAKYIFDNPGVSKAEVLGALHRVKGVPVLGAADWRFDHLRDRALKINASWVVGVGDLWVRCGEEGWVITAAGIEVAHLDCDNTRIAKLEATRDALNAALAALEVEAA